VEGGIWAQGLVIGVLGIGDRGWRLYLLRLEGVVAGVGDMGAGLEVERAGGAVAEVLRALAVDVRMMDCRGSTHYWI